MVNHVILEVVPDTVAAYDDVLFGEDFVGFVFVVDTVLGVLAVGAHLHGKVEFVLLLMGDSVCVVCRVDNCVYAVSQVIGLHYAGVGVQSQETDGSRAYFFVEQYRLFYQLFGIVNVG